MRLLLKFEIYILCIFEKLSQVYTRFHIDVLDRVKVFFNVMMCKKYNAKVRARRVQNKLREWIKVEGAFPYIN